MPLQVVCHPQEVEMASWDLPSEVLHRFLPRLCLTAGIGVLLAVMAKIAGFNALGIAEMVVTASFWAAAFMMLTFRGHVGRMLFWLLLLDASLLLYQAGIYRALPGGEYTFIRLGPVILAGLFFLTCSGGSIVRQPAIYIAWVACNIPAFVAGGFQGYLSPCDAFLFFGIAVLYPLVFYYSIGCLKRANLPLQVLWDGITVSVLVMSSIPLLLIPVELSLRGAESFATLQFGGRAYSVIGCILLLWPILVVNLNRWTYGARVVAIGLIVLIIASSFSRGAIATFLFLLAGSYVLGGNKISKLFYGLASVLALLILGAFLFFPHWLSEFGLFWLLRMNLFDNISSSFSFDYSATLETGRLDIWTTALQLFEKSPLGGYGIGSTPSLLKHVTANEFSFSGMHNMLLTVAVERGILGLLGLLLLVGRIAYLMVQSTRLPVSRYFMLFSFIIFMIFANTTGVELFLNSSRWMNVTLTVYLFCVIGFLEYNTGVPPRTIQRWDMIDTSQPSKLS